MTGTNKAQKADDTHVAAILAAGGFNAISGGGGQMTLTQPASVAEFAPDAVSMTPAVHAKRHVKALNLVHIEPGMAHDRRPVFEWVQPTELLVDEAYQRSISERSLDLIRKIVANWDWRRFKPPVVARTDAGLLVVDGQHTAIAAATHPEISEIPIMLIGDLDQAAQAKAFVGHNRDRLGITAMQMHFAALSAGDEDAQTIAQVCERAGVNILRNSPGGGVFKPRDTMAVQAIAALINRRGAQKARIVLQVLAEAHCAPIAAAGIKAIEMLLHDAEYRDQVAPADLTSAVMALGQAEAEQEAAVFAAAHGVPKWKALGIVIFKRARRGRRRTD